MAKTKSAATKSAKTKSAKAKSAKAKSAVRSVALKKSAPRKKAAPKVHTAKISFEIDPAAAVKYLGWSFEKKYTEAELALAVGDAISEMIEVSNAHNLGAIRIVKNEFVR